MARSTYIYVATHFGEMTAGFTVKRELVAWLRGMLGDISEVEVFRMEDGSPRRPPVLLNIEELLATS